MHTKLMEASAEAIELAARVLREGGLVAFPTETVYGLGADALNPRAVASIFAAKGRPADNPLIAHIAREEDLAPLIEGEPSPVARALMRAYWPGPLTLIFPRSRSVPDEVTAGLNTLAVRMPSHPIARALILAAGRPIAAPSANRSGRPSPTTAAHVMQDLDGRVPLILDGGPCEIGLESTVLDVAGPTPRVLRPGGVTPEMIARVAGAVELDGALARPLAPGERPRSPGMKYRHYAPRGSLTIVRGEREAVARAICAMYDACAGPAAILARPGHRALYGARRAIDFGAEDTAESAAAALFAALRSLDDEGVEAIFAEAVDERGVGLAVMNRLGRAAAFHIVDAGDGGERA